MKESAGVQRQTMTDAEPSLYDELSRGEARHFLLRHREGDPEAFPRLVTHYRAPVYSYLIRCGVLEADRDDLFQEIFIKIHQSAGQYQAERPLHPWLFTVVANTVRSYHRKHRIRRILFSSAPVQEPKDNAPNGEQITRAKQTARWLDREIQALPFIQRQVLVLACIESLGQKDIAEALCIPLNTVKTHLRRARLALAGNLARRNAASKEMTS